MFRRSSAREAAGAALLALLVIAVAVGLHAQSSTSKVVTGADIAKVLPPPDPSKAGTRFSKVIGWPEGLTPKAGAGFSVAPYATGLAQPRWLRVLPNGDVLVAESEGKLSASPNRITLLRDTKQAGKADQRSVLIADVRQPFGMLLKGDVLYVAGSDALWTYPFKVGETSITAKGTKILDLPTGQYNYHWTRDVVANADGSKLFVSVGSGTNVDEEHDDRNEPRRATVLEVNPDGSGMRIFASGLRNPVGLAINPESKALWAVINERDMLGDELVPDYMTSVKDGAFYGWPYWYLRADRGSAQERRAPGSGGQGHSARHAARRARRTPRHRVLRWLRTSRSVQERRVRERARVVESHALQRLQGRVRTVQRRHAVRCTRGCAHRLHQG